MSIQAHVWVFLKNRFRFCWPLFRRKIYSLTVGFCECEFTGYNDNGNIIVIAAAKGSIFDGSLEITKVFWYDSSSISMDSE